VWKYIVFFSLALRSPLSTASAASSTSGMAREFIGLVMTPGANCPGSPTTWQMVLPWLPERSRFITTVPTAIMPSRLERLDSKNIALSRHSLSFGEWLEARDVRKLGVMASVRPATDMPCEVVWLQAAKNRGDVMTPSNSGVFHRVTINRLPSHFDARPQAAARMRHFRAK